MHGQEGISLQDIKDQVNIALDALNLHRKHLQSILRQIDILTLQVQDRTGDPTLLQYPIENKILLIKLVREFNGMGLKESKEWTEKIGYARVRELGLTKANEDEFVRRASCELGCRFKL